MNLRFWGGGTIKLILNYDNSVKLGKFYLFTRKNERRPEPHLLSYQFQIQRLLVRLAVHEEYGGQEQKQRDHLG